jgi:translocation and assembly module TamA
MNARGLQLAALLAALLAPLAAAPAAAAPAARIKVEIEGLEGELLANARAFLSIERYKDSPDLSDASVERLHARARDELRAALRPFGYYRTEVEATLAADERGWIARYRVTAGTPALVRGFDVAVEGAGRDDPAFATVLAEAPLALGAPARHDRYEALKHALLTAAEDSGYLEARFVENALEVDPVAGEARVRLKLATGERSYFGALSFEQDVVDQDLIDRFVEIHEGEPFSMRKLLSLQYALNDSNYFRLVEIEPQREAIGPDRRIPVVVRLTPRERKRWTFGLGYGTDTGPRGSIGWEDRRINRRGHRATAELADSEVKTELKLSYSIPLAHPASERLSFQGEAIEEEKGDTLSRRTEVGARIDKTYGHLKQTLYLQFEYERSDFPTDPDLRSQLLVPGVIWSVTHSDSPLFTRDGERWTFDLHGASDSVYSDISFYQYQLTGKLVRSIGERSRFITRAQYARSLGAALDELPVSQRLFAGGDQSVRGYGYESIGETDVNGKVIGGTELAVASVELDHLFTERWGAAVFVDAGDAHDTTPFDAKVGAGTGLRWRSPIGMLRLDIAWALDDVIEGWHIHFAIGPDL